MRSHVKAHGKDNFIPLIQPLVEKNYSTVLALVEGSNYPHDISRRIEERAISPKHHYYYQKSLAYNASHISFSYKINLLYALIQI